MDPHPIGVPFRPSDTDRAWQDSHEPTLLVRAWKMDDGNIMVSIRWAREIEALPVEERPIGKMAGVALRVYERMLNLLEIMAGILTVDQVMQQPIGGNEVKH